MVTRKIGPALAAGCTVVAKSPGETPFTSLALAELARRAGIPKGVVNIVTALRNTAEIGEALTTNPTVRKVSFTGSTNVGKLLMKQSSDTLKKLSFELGGNAPFIVFNDADLELAVNGAISSKFRSSGQTCVCANRIFVQKGIYDKFASQFAKKVKGFKVGPGFEEAVTHGPLIHGRAISKVDAHVRDAEKKGGKVIVGGLKMPKLGANFYEPTVITGMTKDMQLASEETFGPVAGLFPFETEKEVIDMANSAEVGLAGYFYSKDLQRVYRIAEALEVGMVGVNTGLISDPAAPYVFMLRIVEMTMLISPIDLVASSSVGSGGKGANTASPSIRSPRWSLWVAWIKTWRVHSIESLRLRVCRAMTERMHFVENLRARCVRCHLGDLFNVQDRRMKIPLTP